MQCILSAIPEVNSFQTFEKNFRNPIYSTMSQKQKKRQQNKAQNPVSCGGYDNGLAFVVNYCHFYYKFLKKVWPCLYYTKSSRRIKLTDSLSKHLQRTGGWSTLIFLITILSTIFTHTERFLCARHNAWQIEQHCLTLPLRSFQFEDSQRKTGI